MAETSVTKIQQALFMCGHFPGTVDGMMGPNTKKAIQSFQESQGLSADGVMGPNTRKALAGRLAEVAAQANALLVDFSQE